MDKIKLNLFEKAKQAVAEKHFCDTWADLLIIADNVGADLEIFYQEVAEWVANEAVKADRDNTDGYYKEYMSADMIIKWYDLQFRPLPFPQQPDER